MIHGAEFTPEPDKEVARITTAPEFTLTLDLKLESEKSSWSNLITFTKNEGERSGTHNRIPAIYIRGSNQSPQRGLHIRMGRTSDNNAGCDPSGYQLQLNKWTNLKLQLSGSNFKVYVNDELKCTDSSYASKYPGFDDVYVMAGAYMAGHTAPAAKIKNLQYWPHGTDQNTDDHQFAVDHSCRWNEQCNPITVRDTQLGAEDPFRGWYDVQGCGSCLDYCRSIDWYKTKHDLPLSLQMDTN